MKEGLKPEKYPQGDLFVCDITDVILKDDLASMEHPFYSLSKKPDRKIRRYEHKGQWIEFRPSVKGLPTIYDKDIIIYAISQLIAAMKEGRPISKSVRIDPYRFLVFSQRGVGGRDYDALCNSIDRIDGTRFRTNTVFNGTRTDEWMGIIDGARLDTDPVTGKIRSFELRLSDMVISSVKEMRVLTLNRGYFRLERPIERRLYEMARKAVGQNESWTFQLSTLHKKSGSKSSIREFKRQLKPILSGNYLPDYFLTYDDQTDTVTFLNRNTMQKNEGGNDQEQLTVLAKLSPDIYEKARKIAVGWDIYYVANHFAKWWINTGKTAPKNSDALFLKFCLTWQEKNGTP